MKSLWSVLLPLIFLRLLFTSMNIYANIKLWKGNRTLQGLPGNGRKGKKGKHG
nr:MAG TPA: hypothetical protein [Caudoviricetes sp.]